MLRKAVGGWCLVAPQMQADDTLVVREIASVSPVKQQCINVLCEAHHHIIYCHIYVSRWSKEHELKVLIPSPQSFPPTSGLENTFRLTCIIFTELIRRYRISCWGTLPSQKYRSGLVRCRASSSSLFLRAEWLWLPLFTHLSFTLLLPLHCLVVDWVVSVCEAEREKFLPKKQL